MSSLIDHRLHLNEISRQMCRDHHQHSELFQNINQIHDENYHPCPSMICVVFDYFLTFFPTQTCSCCGCTLSSWKSNLSYVLPWSITIFYDKVVLRIAPPPKNSLNSDTSHHHQSFLVPVLILTMIPTSEWCCLGCVLLATVLL